MKNNDHDCMSEFITCKQRESQIRCARARGDPRSGGRQPCVWDLVDDLVEHLRSHLVRTLIESHGEIRLDGREQGGTHGVGGSKTLCGALAPLSE